MGGLGEPIKININGHGCDNTKELGILLVLVPLDLVGLE